MSIERDLDPAICSACFGKNGHAIGCSAVKEAKNLNPNSPFTQAEYDVMLKEHEVKKQTTLENPRFSSKSAFDTQVGGDHYKGLEIQPVEFCQRNKLHACETSIVKYISRHQLDGGAEDVQKVIHYAQLLLEMEYPEALSEK